MVSGVNREAVHEGFFISPGIGNLHPVRHTNIIRQMSVFLHFQGNNDGRCSQCDHCSEFFQSFVPLRILFSPFVDYRLLFSEIIANDGFS